MTIVAYLRALRCWLGRGHRARRILDEIECHLEDAAASLRERGVTDPEREAVKRFGSPARTALDFWRRTPSVLLERVEPFALFGTTLVTLVFCAAATFFTTKAIFDEGANPWSVPQLVVSSGFAWLVILIWLALGLRRGAIARLARTAGPWVLGLGVAGFGLATWSGYSSGDWEYYLHVMHGNVAVMGLLMIRCFSPPPSDGNEAVE